MKILFRISGVILLVLSIFLIHSCKKDKLSPPVITAIRISSISYNTTISGGNVIDDGGSVVTARGVCWSTSPNPTISLITKTIDGTGTGAFTSSITGLTAGTTYYVRAYATNNIGDGYGTQLVFTTTAAKVPFLTTTVASSITQTTAISGGLIASDGGTVVTALGVCWSTSANPTTADSKTNDGAGLGSFSSSITGLAANTTYYLKAYALNSVGTSYGNEVTFTTSVAPSTVPGAPTIETASAGNAQAVVTFIPPVSNGGSAITRYTVTSSPGSLTATGTASPITVTGLTNGIAYTFTVTATNAIGTGVASSASNSVTPAIPTVSDIDGNVYHTVTIGMQVWLTENLKTTKYNDGTAIPNITDNTAWVALITGAYSDHSNTPANSTTYGRLYNWYVVDNNAATKMASNGSKNVCPTGWHVPSDVEWTTLTTSLGGESIAGGKLKEIGLIHWLTPNSGATNETGFAALPGGSRNEDGTCDGIGVFGDWWSSTEYSAMIARGRYMMYDDGSVHKDEVSKIDGISVRCLKDY